MLLLYRSHIGFMMSYQTTSLLIGDSPSVGHKQMSFLAETHRPWSEEHSGLKFYMVANKFLGEEVLDMLSLSVPHFSFRFRHLQPLIQEPRYLSP